MIIAARAVEGTPVGPGQAGLKSNHRPERALQMLLVLPVLLLLPLVLPVLLLTGAELGSGVSQRVAPDHSYHSHCLPTLISSGRVAQSSAPPITAAIVSNVRYRTTTPISSKPAAYPSLPPTLPVTADFLRLPRPGFVARNCTNLVIWIS